MLNLGSSVVFVGGVCGSCSVGGRPCLRRCAPRSGHAALQVAALALSPPTHPVQPLPYVAALLGEKSSSLRSSSTRTLGLYLTPRRLLTWCLCRKVKIKSASGGPAQRATGIVVRLGLARAEVGVACAGRVALLAWHRRRPGTCREGKRRRLALLLNLTFAACPPDRTTGRATPARRGERPDLSPKTVRCARPGQRSCRRRSMLNSTSGDHLRFWCALDRAGPGIFCSSRPPAEALN